MSLSPSHKQTLYEVLYRYLKSGISPEETLLALAEEDARFRVIGRRIAAAIQSGATLTEGLAGSGIGLSEMERAVLEAGETGGRLDAACSYLAGWQLARVTSSQAMWRASLYPLFLLHAAAFLGPFPSLLLGGGDQKSYFVSVFTLLGGAYLLGGACWLVLTLALRLGGRLPTADHLLRGVPMLGRLWRSGGLGRFCAALDAQIRAGISPLEALPRSARAARLAAIQAAVNRAIPAIEAGSDLVAALKLTPHALPPSLSRGLTAAETTGQLDEELERWANLYTTEQASAWKAITDWLPKLLYFVIAGVVAWQILKAAQGIKAGYMKILDGF